ncbi:MAG: NAD-dependent epimerase/dehydratase family protein [Pirellulaceae bacterium]|nr:NAD-dependent epimerase/dehydratase family protein [Pirellulaceae bacterium]
MSHPLADDLNHVLDRTRELWEELRGKHLFITGGTGFFGKWLLESFVWANKRLALQAEVHVLTRDPSRFGHDVPHLVAEPCIRLVPGNVRAFEFPAGEFSHVIHAAAESSTKREDHDDLSMFHTVVLGTSRVLEFAQQCGARKLLFTSSGAVYGRQPSELSHVGEDHAGGPRLTDPHAPYGEAKRAAEQLCCLHAQGGLECKIARCFAFVGPHLPLNAHFAVGNFLGDALAGRPIRIAGDGTPFRSYLYAADLAIWLWTILLRGRNGRPYNVGSDEEISIADLAMRVAGRFSPQPEVSVALKPGSGPPPQYVPDTRRARSELGLQTWIGLDEALDRTIRFHTRSPTGCPEDP